MQGLPVKLRCAACQDAFDAKEWSHQERNNHRTHSAALVCKACRARGYHPQDVRTYTCNNCSGKFGGKHFDAQCLKDHNKRGDRLQCKNCIHKKKHKEREDADREKRIKEKLKNGRDHTKKAAWKCTCKKPVHDEKCQLFSTEYGTRKWAGKNVGVTEDDLHFLSQRELLAKRQKRE